MAFYAVRGVPLDVLAAATPAERGFLQGARALYYEEQAALRQEYIAAIRASLRGTLNNISIQEPDGSITDLGRKYGKIQGE